MFFNAFQDGIGAAWDAVTTPEAQHAFYLTMVMVAVAVPLNTIFGMLCALAIVRQRFRGRALLNAMVDLPFAVSPVVVGLALLLVYGRARRLGGRVVRRAGHPDHLLDAGHDPGHDVRVAAVRGARGDARAARDRHRAGAGGRHAGRRRLQTFFRVTLPAIRWGVAYGVVLTTARALGEFGAVSVVSGQDVRPDRDRDAARREPLFSASTRPAPMLRRWSLRCWPWSTLLAMNVIKPKEAQA